MVLSNLFQEQVNFPLASQFMIKPVGGVLVVSFLVLFYTMTGSVSLSVVLALLAALLSCWGFLWKIYQLHLKRNRQELQDIFTCYDKTGSRFWVAVEGETIVGTVALNRASDTRAELTRMCVLPPHRRKGLATRLVKHFEDFCKSDGVQEMFMSTTEFHQKALSLYQKCGYTISDIDVRSPLPMVYVSIVELSKKVQ
ncbi:hypothetical protein Bbelb_056460 [Branchiostoma belcheri]|nr:hypothetical protein Bbelb_056460 [Branchiostoma belcheri]